MYNFTTSRPVESSHKCDIWLIVSVILLWGFGICTLYICSSYVINGANALKTQLICSAIGFAGMIFFALLDMKHIQKLVVVIVFVAIILCILAAFGPLSVEKNGGKRWIALPGGNSFQPSELLKLAVILYLANFFDKEYDKPEEDKFVLPAVAMFFLMLGTVVIQKKSFYNFTNWFCWIDDVRCFKIKSEMDFTCFFDCNSFNHFIDFYRRISFKEIYWIF